MADPTNENAVLLVNPGGKVVEVTTEHAEQLLASDEGFREAPEGAKAGDDIDKQGNEVPAQNNLVPNGSSEEEAKRIADLQGTPENLKKQAEADPTNDDVQTPPAGDADMDSDKNDSDPGAGGVGEHNTGSEDAPVTTGQNDSQPADDGKKAGRFFGRKK